MTRNLVPVLMALGLLGAACGGAPPPRDQLSAAQASAKGAEVGGAPDEPKAALHLKLAQESIAKAQAAMEDGDNEEAAWLVERAQADADLALILAKEAKARSDTTAAKEQIDEIKERIGK